MSGRNGNGVPLEDFIQALSSQLDRVQSGMALKVKAGLPLTFAVKDLSLDLKAHVDVDGPVVRIRSASPGDADASTLRLAMTTITRPLMEENTASAVADPSDSSLHDALGSELSPDDLRRLEWAGVQTVSQLRRLQATAGENAIGRISNVPAMRLRMALERANQPAIHDVQVEPPIDAPPPRIVDRAPLDRVSLDRVPLDSLVPGKTPIARGPNEGQSASSPPADHEMGPVAPADGIGATHIRVAGRNFLRDGPPVVRLGDQRLQMVSAAPRELVVRAPAEGVLSGILEVETPAGIRMHHVLPDRSEA
jgi:hypothetical protein